MNGLQQSDLECLVTGATNGIGYATALRLAQLGATTILIGRNPERTEATAARIRREVGSSRVAYLIADLSSQRDIGTLVAQVRERFRRLNVLINNAGLFTMRRTLTADGIELQWAVNHLAYYMIAESLADILMANAPARIIQVASDAHYDGKINFDDLSGASGYSGTRAYGQSKLANVLHTYDLARRLMGSGVTANCLHPGVIRTGIARGDGGVVALAMVIRGLFTPGPAEGARTPVYLATSPDLESTTGTYFANCKPKTSAAISYDLRLQERLREKSAQMTGVQPARM